MSFNLAPLVVRKLQQFKRRRNVLILVRGLSSGIVVSLLGVAIVGGIDWYWLLSDQTRWFLSCGIYTSVLASVWITCLRQMVHLPALNEIASQMELSEPQLRENLLSAVELAADDPAAVHDSPIFRSLLQGKVADQMGTIRVPHLLPFKLVAKWLVAAACLLGLAGGLLSTGDVRFLQLATRAILPGANIARVSRIQVEVLKPTPHSFTMAEDETVAVLVEVSGGSVNEVILETFTQEQGALQQRMRGEAEKEFVANIHVANESVEYRILAGDAITQKFRIDAKPRPRATLFHKRFDYPEYTQLPHKRLSEENGDLLVLQGTRAELILELDQPVSEAELRISPTDSDEIQVIPLEQVTQVEGELGVLTDQTKKSGMLWKAIVTVEQAAIYKVHFVSKETGFENLFSPKYQIQPQPDLIPRVGFVDQEQLTLLLPPNDLLALQGQAEDDLPLAGLAQHVSINGLEWESIPLATVVADKSEGRQLTANWQWDLLSRKLKTGDQVLTKLVATDRKGNTGESVPLRIIIAAQDFDPQRHAIMQHKAALYDELAEYAEFVETKRTSAIEIIERLRKSDRPSVEQREDQLFLLDLASQQREQAGYLTTKIKTVLSEMPAGADAYELDLVGQVIARLQHEFSYGPAVLLKAYETNENEQDQKKYLDEIKKTFERSADAATSVAKNYQHLLSHNFLAAVAIDLDALHTQQRLIVESPTQSWERLLRQETIVVHQMQNLDSLIADQRQRLPSSLDGHMTNLIRWSESQRQQLQDSMESEDQLEQLQKVSASFFNELSSRQNYGNIDGALPNRLTSFRRDFENRAGSLSVPIDHLARSLQQENRLLSEATTSADSKAGLRLRQEADRFIAEVDLQHRHSLDQFQARREFTQARRDGDAQYAADIGLTRRATTSIINQHRALDLQASPLPDHLLEIGFAYRILEAGHAFQQTQDALELLANKERWDSQNLQGRLEHPRLWDLVNAGFELTSQRLREARVPNEIVGHLDQLRWSAASRDAGRKLGERRWKQDQFISAGHELLELRSELSKLADSLQPVMQAARDTISQYTPTIPQMAEQAAEQLRELEKSTTQSADQIEQKQQTEFNELNQQQFRINQQLADLAAALVEDANAQDLMDTQQRERARDADDGIAMIEEPAQKMNQALQLAQQNPSPEVQAQQLAQAAEQQEKTAKALDTVANHFQRLEEGADLAESRAALRQAEQELGLTQQLDQRFQPASQFELQASQNAQQLMEELNAELQRNPAMQQALSEIAQNALQEARNSLQSAAQDDQNIQRANERSDSKFQEKKKAVAEDLRELAANASQLARTFVAQGSQSAARGKTEQAQKKLTETQKKLNEIATKASQAREDQLLADLSQAAQETLQALQEAAASLLAAKNETSIGKDVDVHPDNNSREAQKRDSEKQRQQFQEQEKRSARDAAKRVDDVKRRADQNVRNAENQQRTAEKRTQQVEKDLKRHPDDQGLQNRLKRERMQVAAEDAKVQQAKELQKIAETKAKEAHKVSDEINRKKYPPLDAKNPATQLADEYTEEALKLARELERKANQILGATEFGKVLTPAANQLAASEQQQQQVTQDVKEAAEDVARAARHERRLEKRSVAEPLASAAEKIQQVANRESKLAESQLSEARNEAETANANQQLQNSQGLEAQAAVASAEQAISQQAGQLSSILEPLLDAARNAKLQKGELSGSEPSSESSAANSPTSGNLPSSESNQNGTAPSFSREELARGQQFARTLDELDRRQIAVAAAQGEPNGQPLDSLAQTARAERARQAAARAQAQQSAALAMSENATESTGVPATTGAETKFDIANVNRKENADWGKLRRRSAEDLTKGKTEGVSEEYRKSVETYFRVLAERAKRK